MNRFIPYMIISLLVALTSCRQNETIISPENEDNLQICISTGKLSPQAVTRTSPGDDNYNENKLTRVDCFFYPLDGGDSAPLYEIIDYRFGENTTRQGTISNTIPEDVIDGLFPNGATTCLVYIVANRPTGVDLPASHTINSLKGMLISADFLTVEKQADFVMDGQSTVTLTADGKQVGGNVVLYRAASKIALFVTNVADKIVDEAGGSWSSNPAGMKIMFHDGVNKTHVDVTKVPYAVQAPADYFEFTVNNARSFVKEASTNYYTTVPFYSYSSDWNANTEREAYFTLILPWKREGEDVYRTCYYQIPVNSVGKAFVRNHYYRINLKVGILGAFKPDTDVTLNPSYIVVDWGTEEVNAELNENSYLVVETNRAEMPNVSQFTQSFASSHKITVTIDKIQYFNYQNATTRQVTITPTSKTVTPTGQAVPDDKITYDSYTVNIDQDANTFTFSHTVPPSTTYVPHEIYLTVTNEVGMTEKVHYTWYPPIYIIGEKSNGVVFVNSTENNKNGNNNVESDSDDDIGSVTGRGAVNGTGDNNNQNQYTIYVTSLPPESMFYIGDPREETSSLTGFGNITVNSSSVSKVKGYRKTDAEANMMIAPVFKIASSYGKTFTVTHENAHRRCAAYQENGYPAGRWRVPTKGEIQYVVGLSTGKIIPSLFDGGYWSSTQFHSFSSDNGWNTENAKDSKYYVRCVYDVWYWGDSKIKNLNADHENNEAHWSVEYE